MSPASPKSPKNFGTRFWWVQEEERITGPYTGKQMLSFLLRGRLRATSLIRPETETEWRAASEDPEFSRYFEKPAAGAAPRRDVPAGEAGPLSRPHRMPNFLILVDGDAYPDSRIEAVIGELGAHLRLMPHIWLLHCGLQVEKIRTYLVRHLGAIEGLFIVDVPNGIYAAHQFGDNLAERIRALLIPPGDAQD